MTRPNRFPWIWLSHHGCSKAALRPAISWVLALSALLQVLGQAPVAEAQTAGVRRRARALFHLGVRQHEQGRFEDALRVLARSYELAPSADAVFKIAQCHFRLGHDAEAAANFRLFMSQQGSALDRAQAQRLLRQVEARLAQRRNDLRQQMLADVRQEQRRLGHGTEIDDEEPHETAEQRPERGGSSVSLATWLSLGTGVVMAGVGGLFAIDTAARQSDFDDPALDCHRAIQRCRELVDAGDRSALLRAGLLAAGGAAIALGTILLTVDLSSGDDARSALTLSPRPVLAGAALDVGGTW